MKTLELVEARVAAIRAGGAWVLGAGGDHLMSLPLLRGLKRAAPGTPPLGMVHFDAHSDTADTYFGGSKFTHGTPFRRAIEEGILDPRRIVQIGIRGTLYEADDMAWATRVGIRILRIEECEELGPDGVIAEARRVIGDGPAYLTFDIDSLDPLHAARGHAAAAGAARAKVCRRGPGRGLATLRSHRQYGHGRCDHAVRNALPAGGSPDRSRVTQAAQRENPCLSGSRPLYKDISLFGSGPPVRRSPCDLRQPSSRKD
jgi:hypothetical protein